ncbi:uncharacterized protein LOC113306696 [Papaver somniferum]|uniref:uncharacterized protein LOC113306696 n=1 Tax=Papaver somniferum TaxID=3469 RepID=UPI000E6F60F7|nr:uncharacterized protein LOC113306696 [Papaver somniferum]
MKHLAASDMLTHLHLDNLVSILSTRIEKGILLFLTIKKGRTKYFSSLRFTVILSLTYEELLLQSLLSLGYNSNFWFLHSFPRLCVTGFAFLGAKKMFVHRPDRDRFLLLLLFDRVITIEISCENLVSSKYLIIIDSKLNCKDSVTLLFDDTRSLFDRGKEIELSLRTSWFTKCTEIMSQIDVCLEFLPRYYRVSVPELIHEQGVSSTQLLGKMIQIDIVYKLFFRHGFRLDTFSMKYILLAFRTGDIGDVFMWCLRMWRKVYFLLQLKYGSLHELEVQILESLDVLGIHIESLESFSEFIMFILHQVFLYLQLGIHSPLVLLIHTKHCNLFEMDAIRKIHALFVKMLLQNHVSWFNWIMQFVPRRCFTLRYVYPLLVYDRGKEFEQLWVCFWFDVSASNYQKYTCSLILHDQVLVQQPTLMYGYQSELLFVISYLLVFITTDDCGASGYLSVKKAQRNNVYESTLTCLFGIWLRSIVWSRNRGGTHTLLHLQHGLIYDTGDTVVTCAREEQCKTNLCTMVVMRYCSWGLHQ